MHLLLPLFIIMPIIEMVLLIKVGQWLGVVPTVGLVLLTAVIGLHLLRQQGFSTLLRANQKIEQGGLPAQEIIEGILLAVGGALLLTPGFFTDAIGFCCLIPVSRKILVKQIIKRGVFMATSGQGASFYSSSSQFYSQSDSSQSNSSPFNHDQNQGQGDIIDGEFSRDDQSKLP